VLATVQNDTPPIAGAVNTARRSLHGRFVSNAYWSIGSRAASIGSVFATSVILARALSTGEFSAYTVAAAAAILLAMLAGFGAPRVLLRVIREGMATGRPGMAVDSLRGCAKLTLLSCLAIAVTLVVCGRYFDEAEKWQSFRDYGFLVGAWISLSAMCQAASHALQGFDDFRAAAAVGARNGGSLSNLLVLAAVAVAAALGQLSLRYALLSQVLANAAVLTLGLFALRSAVRQRAPSSLESGSAAATQPAALGWFFRESWPILIIQLTSLGLAQLDILMVGYLTDEGQVAAYGAVSRLCEVLASGQVLAAALASPFMSELHSTGQSLKLERLIRGITSLVAIPSLVLATAYIVAPRLILAVVYRPEFVVGAAALQWAAAGSLVACISGLNSITMIMVGRQRELLRISILANLVFLALAPWMIHNWGITGAAAAGTLVFGPYNLIVTLVVKARVGVWTLASFSPAAYREALRIARSRGSFKGRPLAAQTAGASCDSRP
jgi:O-antigen/teichoic acid export membrane protein